jgi:cobalt/nickel transport system permease protein
MASLAFGCRIWLDYRTAWRVWQIDPRPRAIDYDSGMTLPLEHLEIAASPLGRWDARWKMAALVPAAFVVALLQSVPTALVALAAALLLVLLGRLPPRWYVIRLGALMLVLGLFVIWLPFFHDGGPTWQLGPVSVSGEGVRLAGLIVIKGMTIVTLLLVLWATAPVDVNLKAARALRVPGVVVHLCVLTYRYVFLLVEEMGRLRIALRVRGYRNRATLHSYRTIGHVAGTLLVRSYERAERVGQAMRCRGFDGEFRSLARFRTRALDVAGFFIIVCSAVGLLVSDLTLR